MSSNNTGVVLFHGAGLGSWIWDAVLPHLTVPHLALDLPGRAGIERPKRLSLDDCAEQVAGQLREWTPENLVLVGHSVSGGLAMRVATLLGGRVVGVVMVGAVVPPPGGAYVDVFPWFSRAMLKTLFFFVPQGAKAPDGVLTKALCSDLDGDDTKRVLDRSVVPLPRLFLDKVPWDDRIAIGRTYVKLTDDQSDVTPALQDRMAARLGADVIEIPAGHLPMLSRPAELAQALNASIPH